MFLVDSHCHLDFPVFDDNRQALIENCQQRNIKKFIVPGVTANTWSRLKNTAKQFPSIYPAYGLHPYFIDEHLLEHVDQLKNFLQKNKAIAIGEIGLDYYLTDLDKKSQHNIFAPQLELAVELNLPVILHVRKAHDDVLAFLKKHQVIGGAVHAFNGSFQQAKHYIDLGFKLGFGGAMTFDKAKHLRKLVSQLPLDALLLETDSPDMKPIDHGDDVNTPLTILRVLQEIVFLRSENTLTIENQLTENTYSAFPRLK